MKFYHGSSANLIQMELPSYTDGMFHLFSIGFSDDAYQEEKLSDEKMDIWFQDLSISDVNKSTMHQNGVKTTRKIRIPQYKKIDSMSVVKIEEEYYQVYNAYHFRNKDGFLETDLTLTRYAYDKK